MSARSRRVPLVVWLAAAIGAHAFTAAGGGTIGLVNCNARQLRLSGHVSTASQSLLGTLTLTNRSGRACALPPAPQRVSLTIGRQVLPTVTVRMRGSRLSPGVPTRTLPAHGRVWLGVEWRNWCGAPRGAVRARLALTIFVTVTPRLALGTVTTPHCANAKFSSTVRSAAS